MQLATRQAWLSWGLILVFSGQHHHLFPDMKSSNLVLRRLGVFARRFPWSYVLLNAVSPPPHPPPSRAWETVSCHMRCWGDLKSLERKVLVHTSHVCSLCGKESQPGLQIVEKLATLLHIQFCPINLSSNNFLSKEAFSVSWWVNFLYRQGSITTASKTHRTTSYKKPMISPWVIVQLLKFKPNVFASFFTGNILWKQQIKN